MLFIVAMLMLSFSNSIQDLLSRQIDVCLKKLFLLAVKLHAYISYRISYSWPITQDNILQNKFDMECLLFYNSLTVTSNKANDDKNHSTKHFILFSSYIFFLFSFGESPGHLIQCCIQLCNLSLLIESQSSILKQFILINVTAHQEC